MRFAWLCILRVADRMISRQGQDYEGQGTGRIMKGSFAGKACHEPVGDRVGERPGREAGAAKVIVMTWRAAQHPASRLRNSRNWLSFVGCISLVFEIDRLKFVPWAEILIQAEIVCTRAAGLCVQDGGKQLGNTGVEVMYLV